MYSITGSLGNSGGREQLSVKIRVIANIQYAKLVNVAADKIQIILPSTGYGTATLRLEYYDAGDDYWYTDRSITTTVYDFNPRIYDYLSGSEFFLNADLYETTNGTTYTFLKKLSAAGNNPASKNGYATVTVIYFTGGNADTQLTIGGTVDMSPVISVGASGTEGIFQLSFYTPTNGNNLYGLRNTNSVYNSGCGTGCQQSASYRIENHVLF